MIVRVGGFVGGLVVVAAMRVESCGSASQSPERGDGPVAGQSASASEAGESNESTASSGSLGRAEVELPNPDPHDGQAPLSCTMAGQLCPSSALSKISTELDKAGWTRLRALAEQGVVAVALGDRVELIETCRLPGQYHEGVAAPDSPGRAWSSDRLVFVPDEIFGGSAPSGVSSNRSAGTGREDNCSRATHFVASFAIRGEADGEAIVLPLPCPPLGTGKAATGCIGAGLDDAARKAAAAPLWKRAQPLLDNGEMNEALPLALEIGALIPDAWGYMNILDALRSLDHQGHGGCLWLSEAAFAVHAMLPDHEISIVDISKGRILPSHDYPKCDTRPSLLTCFPGRFHPGTGDNCW
jgi:hypothetical protein